MAATLDQIEAAIFAQLQTLLASAPTPGPLADVVRFAGEPTPTQDKRAALAPHGNTPAALLAFEGEQFAVDAETLSQQATGFVGRSTWRVWLVASSLAGDDAAVKGGAKTGLYALLTAVTGALAGLWIPDLYDGRRLMLAATVPVRNKRGEYVVIVRATADRFVDVVAPADDTDALETIGVNVNLQGDPHDPPPAALGQTLIATT